MLNSSSSIEYPKNTYSFSLSATGSTATTNQPPSGPHISICPPIGSHLAIIRSRPHSDSASSIFLVFLDIPLLIYNRHFPTISYFHNGSCISYHLPNLFVAQK